GRRLIEASSIPISTYALDAEADLRPTEVRVTSGGIAFRIGDLEVGSPLLGRFNVSNCLAAFASARALGIDDDAIALGIGSMTGGRAWPRSNRARRRGAGRISSSRPAAVPSGSRFARRAPATPS